MNFLPSAVDFNYGISECKSQFHIVGGRLGLVLVVVMDDDNCEFYLSGRKLCTLMHGSHNIASVIYLIEAKFLP